MTLLKVLLLLTLFTAPLLRPVNNLGYEQIKILFFILGTSLIGFIWLVKRPVLKWNLIKLTSFLFILSLFVTSLSGLDFRMSLLGKEPYFQGLILYAYLYLFSILISASAIKLKVAAAVLAGSATLVSLVAIQDFCLLNFFNRPIQTYAGRVVSTFGQPNFYAGFLLLSLPFSFFLFKNQSKKLQFLGWSSGVISIVGILVSYSRSTILMALVLLILGLIDQLKVKFRLAILIFGILTLSVLIAWRFSSGIVGKEVSEPFQVNNPDLTRESVEKRAYIWPIAWKLVSTKPLAGYGLENINQAFSSYFEVNKHSLFEENLKISPVLISLKELNIDRSHNYILDLLLSSGVLGLLGWLGIVGLLFWKLKQNTTNPGRNILAVTLGVYLVWVQFQNQSIVHLIYFWFLAGLIDL